MTEIEHVAGGDWRGVIERAIAAGEQFAGAWASGDSRQARWRALLVSPHATRVLSCDASAGRLESIVDFVAGRRMG